MKICGNYIFAVLLLFTSCNKGGLPGETRNGLNTFGCLINGEVFKPQYVVGFPSSPGLSAFYDLEHKDLIVYCTENRTNGIKRSINLKIKVEKTGTTTLNSQNIAIVTISRDNKLDETFITSDTLGGLVTVNYFDLSAKVISGTFYFEAASQHGGGKVVKVTRGRFDLKYSI